VTLTAIGAGGTNSLTQTNYITVTNAPPPPPVLVVNPSALSFGVVFTGSVAQASFVISNAGGLMLSAVAHLAALPFELLDTSTNATPAFAFALPLTATTNVPVRFSPASPGAFTNAVTFLSDGGNSTNEISGVAFGTPVLLDSISGPGEFAFAFETVPGVSYRVQFKDAIDDPLWQTLQTVPGDGALQIITNIIATPAQRFYRLSVP
jgi:PKD repeat protein